MPIRVLIAEDHSPTQAHLQTLVQHHGMTVTGVAATSRDALQHATRHAPDLLILDMTLAEGSGLDVLAGMAGMDPRPVVVIHSMHDEAWYVSEAFRRGASAYVLKGTATSELGDALTAVTQGRPYLSSHLHADLIHDATAPTAFRDKTVGIRDEG